MNASPLDETHEFFGERLSLREIGVAMNASSAKIYTIASRLGISVADAAIRRDIDEVCERWIADAFGMTYTTFLSRRRRGMTPDEAVSEPVIRTAGLDLVDERFGSLRVLRQGKDRSARGRSRMWWCRCQCGRDVLIDGRRLTDGKTKSCGCNSAQRNRWGEATVGATFGRLKVLEVLPPERHQRGVYPKCRCLCECGRETLTPSNRLRSGRTSSCGCLRREVTAQMAKRRSRTVLVFDEYLTMSELERLSGVRKETIAWRMKRHGLSAEKAAFT